MPYLKPRYCHDPAILSKEENKKESNLLKSFAVYLIKHIVIMIKCIFANSHWTILCIISTFSAGHLHIAITYCFRDCLLKYLKMKCQAFFYLLFYTLLAIPHYNFSSQTLMIKQCKWTFKQKLHAHKILKEYKFSPRIPALQEISIVNQVSCFHDRRVISVPASNMLWTSFTAVFLPLWLVLNPWQGSLRM